MVVVILLGATPSRSAAVIMTKLARSYGKGFGTHFVQFWSFSGACAHTIAQTVRILLVG